MHNVITKMLIIIISNCQGEIHQYKIALAMVYTFERCINPMYVSHVIVEFYNYLENGGVCFVIKLFCRTFMQLGDSHSTNQN